MLRDLSVPLDKPIQLDVSGENTEIDRTMIETLADPLIHIARNAIDHGLENQSERAKAGKPKTASIVFRAYQEGGQVVIEFIDDGKGINPQKVKQKAIENGVLDNDAAEKMSDEEAVNLIFAPGFSTAAEVSDISGRGVGLDVVRTNIEKIKGGISVKSTVGEGTTFKMSIPITTAIIDGMVTVSDGITYILPISNVKELLQLSAVEMTETGKNSNVIFQEISLFR
ncbi:MAG: ATP-binding protein [Bdellovibrionales bacterium]